MVSYQKKLSDSTSVANDMKLDQEIEKKRKKIVRSFSIARHMYTAGIGNIDSNQDSELEEGARFLEVYLSTYRWTYDMSRF